DRNSEVLDGEWEEFRSILVQAMKRRLFYDQRHSPPEEVWRQEEHAAGVVLGFEEFWTTLKEPQQGRWPPLFRSDDPLIDPATTSVIDLPGAVAGQQAIQVWESRRKDVLELHRTLQRAHGDRGFDFMLRTALGDPDPGDPLPVDLSALLDALS